LGRWLGVERRVREGTNSRQHPARPCPAHVYAAPLRNQRSTNLGANHCLNLDICWKECQQTPALSSFLLSSIPSPPPSTAPALRAEEEEFTIGGGGGVYLESYTSEARFLTKEEEEEDCTARKRLARNLQNPATVTRCRSATRASSRLSGTPL
jgi:hypothetical protein